MNFFLCSRSDKFSARGPTDSGECASNVFLDRAPISYHPIPSAPDQSF